MSNDTTLEQRRAAADKYAAAIGQRISELAFAAHPERRARAWHDEAMLAASDEYCDACFGYINHGGEGARDRFKATAEALVGAWREAVRPKAQKEAA